MVEKNSFIIILVCGQSKKYILIKRNIFTLEFKARQASFFFD